MADVVSAALGLVLRSAAQPAKAAIGRNQAVIAVLRKLHLDPAVPPADFDTLYAYTLVEWGYGKPDPVLQFFKDQYMKQAVKDSLSSGNWDFLRREADLVFERNQETGEFGRIDYDLRREVAGFTDAFHRLIDRSRTAAQARLESRVENIQEVVARIDRTHTAEERHRQEIDPPRASSTSAERLATDLRSWFVAVKTNLQNVVYENSEEFLWHVDVPVRRGRYDRVVVLGIGGEVGAHHVQTLGRLVDDHAAAEGWCVSTRRVSKAARESAEAAEQSLFCYTFDELIDEEADFEPYIDWLEEEIRRRHIDTRYVPLSCSKDDIDPASGTTTSKSTYDWREGGLENYVRSWIEDPTKKHLSLLGEFGMGKSWFSLKFAWETAKIWREAKRLKLPRPRLPLVIPLRDYAKRATVESMLSEFFFRKHSILPGGYSVFLELNRMGRLLLIFDGFDEMAARVDRNAMVSNFWELAKVVVPGSKVLLSSRTEYFPESKEARDLLGARISASTSLVAVDAPTFEIVDLVPFDDEQVKMMLGHITTPDQASMIMARSEVLDLMRRPVMSELVQDALPEISGGAIIDLARIYLYAVRRKMDRDIEAERTFTSRADKVYFLCEVSWEMLQSGSLSMNYREFPDRIRSFFGAEVESSRDLDYWQHDMRGQGLLIRNSDGDYTPAHKSLIEFFVAYKFAAELGMLGGEYLGLLTDTGEGLPDNSTEQSTRYRWSQYFSLRRIDGQLPLLSGFAIEPTDRLRETFGNMVPDFSTFPFLSAIIRDFPDSRDALLSVLHSTVGKSDEVGFIGGNTFTLLRGFSIEEDGSADVDLRGMNLSGINGNHDLAFQDLSHRDLREVNLRGVDLQWTDLRHSDLTGAHLDGHSILRGGVVIGWDHVGSDNSVFMLDHRSLYYWPAGTPGSSLRKFNGVLAEMPAKRRGVYESLKESHIWVSGGSESHLFDVREGRKVRTVPLRVTGELSSCDRRLLTVFHPSDEVIADLVDPDSLESVGRVNFPTDSPRVFWESSLRLVSILEDSIVIHIFDADELRYDREAARIPFSKRDESFWLSDNSLAIAHNDGGECRFYDLNGRLIGTPPVSVFSAGRRNDWEARFFWTESEKLLVSTTSTGVEARSLEDEWRLVWSHDVALGVNSVGLSPDGTHFVSQSESGELAIRSCASGTPLHRVSFNEALTGVKISRDSGLSPAVLDAVQLAGGEIVD
ncbi:NACHT domain-containing protein [Streptomyces sp. NPDC002499]